MQNILIQGAAEAQLGWPYLSLITISHDAYTVYLSFPMSLVPREEKEEEHKMRVACILDQ